MIRRTSSVLATSLILAAGALPASGHEPPRAAHPQAGIRVHVDDDRLERLAEHLVDRARRLEREAERRNSGVGRYAFVHIDDLVRSARRLEDELDDHGVRGREVEFRLMAAGDALMLIAREFERRPPSFRVRDTFFDVADAFANLEWEVAEWTGLAYRDGRAEKHRGDHGVRRGPPHRVPVRRGPPHRSDHRHEHRQDRWHDLDRILIDLGLPRARIRIVF